MLRYHKESEGKVLFFFITVEVVKVFDSGSKDLQNSVFDLGIVTSNRSEQVRFYFLYYSILSKHNIRGLSRLHACITPCFVYINIKIIFYCSKQIIRSHETIA